MRLRTRYKLWMKRRRCQLTVPSNLVWCRCDHTWWTTAKLGFGESMKHLHTGGHWAFVQVKRDANGSWYHVDDNDIWEFQKWPDGLYVLWLNRKLVKHWYKKFRNWPRTLEDILS